MNRRDFVSGSAVLGLGGALGMRPRPPAAAADRPSAQDGTIPVAFLISRGANVIDLAGAWEVFQDAMVDRDGSMRHPFRLYTVSDSPETIVATGGLKLVPDYTIDTAPTPRLVSVGAQSGSPPLREWLRAQAETADILMSVCTGAFQLAATGLLDGKRATTHHDYWDSFARQYPRVQLVRGARFVRSDDQLLTAGGLTSGIDLALHVVSRYLGPAAAETTAAYMEYRGDGWRDAGA